MAHKFPASAEFVLPTSVEKEDRELSITALLRGEKSDLTIWLEENYTENLDQHLRLQHTMSHDLFRYYINIVSEHAVLYSTIMHQRSNRSGLQISRAYHNDRPLYPSPKRMNVSKLRTLFLQDANFRQAIIHDGYIGQDNRYSYSFTFTREPIGTYDFDPSSGISVAGLRSMSREDMGQYIARVRAAREEISPFPDSIGGNNPPDDIGVPPYNESADDRLAQHILNLEQQSALEEPNRDSIRASANFIDTTGRAILAYLQDMARTTSKAFAEGLGKGLGATAAGGAAFVLWKTFGEALVELADAALRWLHVLNIAS